MNVSGHVTPDLRFLACRGRLMINRTMGTAEWAMLIFLSIVWGGTFFFYAIAVKEIPTLSIVFLRVSIGSLGLWLIAWAIGLPPLRQHRLWRDFFIMGLLNNAIPFSLIVWGQREVTSGLAPSSMLPRRSSQSSRPIC